MTKSGKKPDYRKVRCEVCQKEVDVRGWENHLSKHERESQSQPSPRSSNDPYLLGFAEGYRTGFADGRQQSRKTA